MLPVRSHHRIHRCRASPWRPSSVCSRIMSRSARRVELPIAAPSADTFHPRYVVWELTLRCDEPGAHCGSRAGDARPNELDTEEALRVVGELAAMRAAEVVLIGGEAYLPPGFLRIISALRDAGVRP